MVRCFLPVDASGESGIRIGLSVKDGRKDKSQGTHQNVDGMDLELIALQMMFLDLENMYVKKNLFDVDPCC